MVKQTLILLYGGRSAEREVSVLSAESVMRAINYDKFSVKTYFITKAGDFIKTQEFTEKPSADEKLMTNETVDLSQQVKPSDVYEENAVVFPVLHGPMGEDGSIQGFLEVLRLPYVGCNILSSSVAMDKITTKRILESAGIPQVPYVAVIEGENLEEKIAEIEEKLTYPIFTKPSNMGSSVGISKSENQEELRTALNLAFKYDSRVLVEQGVNAREIEVGLLGNYDVKSTLPGEVVKDVAFYDYEAKYIDNKITMDIPAKLSEDVIATMRQYDARVKLIVFHNGVLGLVRQYQRTAYKDHFSMIDLTGNPDLSLLSGAYGLSYTSISNNSAVPERIREFLGKEENGILEVFVDANEVA